MDFSHIYNIWTSLTYIIFVLVSHIYIYIIWTSLTGYANDFIGSLDNILCSYNAKSTFMVTMSYNLFWDSPPRG